MMLWPITDEENIKMHDALLKQGCTFAALDGLTMAAQRCFRKKGAWLEGLATGKILPLTPRQKQFVSIACGYGEPKTDEEIYWREYQELLKTPWHERKRVFSRPEFTGPITITRGQALSTQQLAEREMNGYRPEAKRPGDSNGIQNYIDSGKDANEFY